MSVPRRTRYRLSYLLFVLLAALVLAGVALAQTAGEVVVNSTLVEDNGDTLRLQLNFIVREVNGQPDIGAIPSAATIHLDDGAVYQARLDPSDTDVYMALLLDVSGSMGPVAAEMRAAALEAVEAAPDGTNFAVVAFDDDIQMVQDFTDDKAAVEEAINSIQPGTGGTCLVDVAITAVQSLQQVAQDNSQRAIILLTDGRDERTQGGGERCSEFTVDQLVALARGGETNVPIHTVALGSEVLPADESALELISSNLGSLAVSGEGTDLAAYFAGIMAGLTSEWQAEADIYLPRGEHTAALFVTLANGEQPLPGTASFVAPRDYPLPIEELQPVAVTVSNFQYDEVADDLEMAVQLTNPSVVGQIRIEVWDQVSNEKVDEFLYNAIPGRQQTIPLNTENLDPRGVYNVRVYPLNRIGLEFQRQSGEIIRAEHPFQYVPKVPITFEAEAVRIAAEQGRMIVDLNIRNAKEIVTLSGRFIDQDGKLETSSFGPVDRVGDLLFLPLPEASGFYQIVVNGQDVQGSTLASTSYEFRYNEATTGILGKAWAVLQENPILWIAGLILLLFFMVLEALLLWAIFRRRLRGELAALREELSGSAPVVTQVPTKTRGNSLAKVIIEHTLNPRYLGEEVEILAVPFVIGREACELTITGDRQISREHASIQYQDGVFTITDLHSSNGTFLDGIELTASEATPLPADAMIRLGQVTQLHFMVTDAPLPGNDSQDSLESLPETAGRG